MADDPPLRKLKRRLGAARPDLTDKGRSRHAVWMFGAILSIVLAIVGWGIASVFSGFALHFWFGPPEVVLTGATVLALSGFSFQLKAQEKRWDPDSLHFLHGVWYVVMFAGILSFAFASLLPQVDWNKPLFWAHWAVALLVGGFSVYLASRLEATVLESEFDYSKREQSLSRRLARIPTAGDKVPTELEKAVQDLQAGAGGNAQ